MTSPTDSQPAGTHRERQKAETKAIILDTARNLFEELGFEKTTMRTLATRARMGYGTIFKHFANKQDLLAACLYEEIEGALTGALKTVPDERGLGDQFMHLAGALIRHYGQRPQLSKILIEQMIHVDGSWKTALDDQVNRFLATLEALIHAARDRGEIRADVPADLLALSFFSTYLAILAMSLRGPEFDPEQTVRALDQLIHLHLKGALA
jgi:AcrR family transcriptional regulator